VCAASTASADLAVAAAQDSTTKKQPSRSTKTKQPSMSAKTKQPSPVISGNAKNDDAEDVASVSSGNAKNEEVEVVDFLYLFMEVYDKDEERKMPPPDPFWLKTNMKFLMSVKNISNKNTATLEKPCPLPSLICKVAEWFNMLSN
jgi:hypothetical protein